MVTVLQLRYFPLPLGPHVPSHDPGHKILGGWVITSYFGGRLDPLTGVPGNHGGMDLAGSSVYAKPLVAVVRGRAWQSWDASGGGWWTGLVDDAGNYFGYGHADAFADPDGPGPLGNYNGLMVEAGTVLGWVGSSGHSTGAHLHFAFRPAGSTKYADPYDLLVDASAGNRFIGAPAPPDLPPVPVLPETPHSIPQEDEMILTMLRWPDKDDVEVLGLDGEGYWRMHLRHPVEIELLQAKGVAVRQLAAGNDALDALYERAREAG